jgi:hypothetical protein
MKLRLAIYVGAVILGLLLSTIIVFGQVLAKQYKTIALGPYGVGVVCLDGQVPTVTNSSGLVIVNCPSK